MEQQAEGDEAVAAAAAVDNSIGKSKGLSVDDFVLATFKSRFYDKDIDVAAIKKALERSTLEGPVARVEMRVYGALEAIRSHRLDLLN